MHHQRPLYCNVGYCVVVYISVYQVTCALSRNLPKELTMDIISMGVAILVLWFVMSKKTKQSLGNVVAEGSNTLSNHIVITKELLAVNATAEITETLADAGVTIDDVTALKARLGLK
jgi:hypothetical protein